MAKDALFPEHPAVFMDPIVRLALLPAWSKESLQPTEHPEITTDGNLLHSLSDHQAQKFIQDKDGDSRLLPIRQLSGDSAAKKAGFLPISSADLGHECLQATSLAMFGVRRSADSHKRLDVSDARVYTKKGISNTKLSVMNQVQTQSAYRVEPAPRLAVDCDPFAEFGETDHENSSPTDELEDCVSESPSKQTMISQVLSLTINHTASNQNVCEPFNASTNASGIIPLRSSQDQPNTRVAPWLNWLMSSSSSNSEDDKVSSCPKAVTALVELTGIRNPADKDILDIAEDSQTDRYGFYMYSKNKEGHTRFSKCEEPGTTRKEENTYRNGECAIPRAQKYSSPVDKASLAETTLQRSSSSWPLTVELSSTHERFSQSMQKLRILSKQHDERIQQRVAKWDAFMADVERSCFPKEYIGSDDIELFGFKASRLLLRRHSSSWFSGITKDGKVETRLYNHLLRLKSTDGIPSKYRNLFWLELSGASNKSVPGEFHRLLCLCQESSDPSIQTNVEQINLDVHRTLSSNKFFFDVEKCQPGPHFCKLQNILYAFIVHNPKVGYSQGMNRIIGNLLLATSEGSSQGTVGISEEGVFWIFVGIVEDLLPRYEQLFFFDPNALPFIQNDVSIAVKQYFANLLPQLFGHLNLLRVEIEIIVLGWWLGLFSEILKSLDIWFHVIDGLMLAKNPNVKLCAYSIAIFKLCEFELLDLKTTGEVYSYFERLKNETTSFVRDVDFLTTCTSIESLLELIKEPKQ